MTRGVPKAVRLLAGGLALAALAAAVFWPVLGAGFLTFDDEMYVTAQPRVREGLTREGARWALAAVEGGGWHPLTWMSHMLDVSLFGMNPGRHHLVSLLLHAAAAVLLFAALGLMTGRLWPGFLAAALFAVHPLHVESVAWVAERKDVLSGLFWALALLAYGFFARRPSAARYLVVILAMVLGLMSKAMAVTLPLILLLLDWWPLGRFAANGRFPWGPRLLEKTPLMALSAASGIVALLIQARAGALPGLDPLPAWRRLAGAAGGYVFYLWKTIWPSKLAVLYPYADASPPAAWTPAAASLLILATVLAVRAARRLPYLTFGWLWYVVTLLPVVGLVQVGRQAVADRYTYIPLTGIFIAAAWGLGRAGGLPGFRRITAVLLSAGMLAGLAAAARRQAAFWKDDLALYDHALAVTSGNYMILLNRGIALARLGRLAESEEDLRKALRYEPDLRWAHYHLGLILAATGRYDEAVTHLQVAAGAMPKDAEVRYQLSEALASAGRVDEARASLELTLELDPRDDRAVYRLGMLLSEMGDLEGAVARFREALDLEPGFYLAKNDLGVALARSGRNAEAEKIFLEMLRVRADDARVLTNLGNVQAMQGRLDEALASYDKALKVQPDYEPARANRKGVLGLKGAGGGGGGPPP